MAFRPIFTGAAMALMLAGTGTGQAFAQTADPDRVTRVEETMRSLRGQIEELQHQLQLLQDQLKRMQEDVDFRFSELSGTGAPAAPAQANTEPAKPVQPPAQSDGIGTLAGVAVADDAGTQLGAPPKPLGTLTLDAPPPGEQPLDLSSLAAANAANLDQPPPLPNAPAEVASIQPTGDPRADYDQAYGLVRSGRYDAAEAAFHQFLASYPADELAPDAQYWLGESLFARGEYAKAAEEFRAGYKAYPKSRRGADTLLKLGLSMAGLGYREEACQMYAATLKQYPDMSNALRQRVKNEQASASC